MGKLILRDRSIKSALALMLYPPIFLALIMFTTDGNASLLTAGGPVALLPYILIGLAFTGALWLVYQYNLVMATFREGITVKGNVIRTGRTSTRTKSGVRRYSYFAVVNYRVNGEDVERRIRLPGNPESYAVTQGMNLDLILREEKPNTAFIKHIYLD